MLYAVKYYDGEILLLYVVPVIVEMAKKYQVKTPDTATKSNRIQGQWAGKATHDTAI